MNIALSFNRLPRQQFPVLRQLLKVVNARGGFVQRDTDDLVLTGLSAVHGLSAFIASGLFVDADAPQVLLTALGERVYLTLIQGLEMA